ncbi:hypothetical protein ABBQ32_007722 [Trebouxia sp. C0010 RCD-2024]
MVTSAMPVAGLCTPGTRCGTSFTSRPICTSPLTAVQYAGASRTLPKTHHRGCISRRGNAVKPACASPIQQLQHIFSLGSPAKSASKEMQAMIQAVSDDAERFGQLVDVLLASELPFKESSLGGGEWQVVYTRGALLWQQLTAPGQVKSTGRLSYKSKRKAGQDFSPSDRLVLNKGELLGSHVVITASGTYEPQDTATNLPKLVKANISGGHVVAWGRRIPLPISGTGFFSVMYVDDTVRVFSDQKKGTVSVQIRADKLRQLNPQSS